MTSMNEAKEFEQWLKREHRQFPLEAVSRLMEMRPGIGRFFAALRLLPALLRMARRALEGRWRSARFVPSIPGIVTVHAVGPGGGFISGWYSDGRWWTHDYLEDGTTWGNFTKREIRVAQWRLLEGCLAEPWHDQDGYHPPSFADLPKRVEAPAVERSAREYSIHTEKLYDRVLQAGRFIKWAPEFRPSVEIVQSILERYFLGIDVEIERLEVRPSRRNGFDIHLNSLPLERPGSCGQDPDTVVPRRQMIFVQLTDAAFHADSGSGAIARALAMGLNVYMMEELERREKEAARGRDLLGADRAVDQ